MDDSTKTEEMSAKPSMKAPPGAEKLAGLYGQCFVLFFEYYQQVNNLNEQFS